MAALPPQCQAYAPLFDEVAPQAALCVLIVCLIMPIPCTMIICRLQSPAKLVSKIFTLKGNTNTTAEVQNEAEHPGRSTEADGESSDNRLKRRMLFSTFALLILIITCFVFGGFAIAGRQYCSGKGDWTKPKWAAAWAIYGIVLALLSVAGLLAVMSLWRKYRRSCITRSSHEVNRHDDNGQPSDDQEESELGELETLGIVVNGSAFKSPKIRGRKALVCEHTTKRLSIIMEEESSINTEGEVNRRNKDEESKKVQESEVEKNGTPNDEDTGNSQDEKEVDLRFKGNPLGEGCSKYFERSTDPVFPSL